MEGKKSFIYYAVPISVCFFGGMMSAYIAGITIMVAFCMLIWAAITISWGYASKVQIESAKEYVILASLIIVSTLTGLLFGQSIGVPHQFDPLLSHLGTWTK